MTATESILLETAAEVFENLVFMIHQPEIEPCGSGQPEFLATVRFKGPFSGTLRVAVPKLVLMELVANLLGEETPAEVQGLDALGELANVICGNVISRIGGADQIFDLETPRVRPLAEPAEDQPDGRAFTSRLLLEKGCADVVLVLDPGAEVGA